MLWGYLGDPQGSLMAPWGLLGVASGVQSSIVKSLKNQWFFNEFTMLL